MKQTFRHVSMWLIVAMLTIVPSCQSDYDAETTQTPSDLVANVRSEVLEEFDTESLDQMEQQLKDAGYDLSALHRNDNTTGQQTRVLLNQLFVKAIKVTTQTDNPDGKGGKIDVSGVLLVPRQTIISRLFSYRMVIAPPPTYTLNSAAPSVALKDCLIPTLDNNFLAMWALQARCGFVVLLPDYPGFGDSFQQCYTPYIEKDAVVNSTIDLIKAAQFTLSANGYRYKKELALTGYSLGATVATQLAREIETNHTHGLSVKLLVAGGTPCDLKQIADIIRHSNTMTHPYLLPYAMWGLKMNKYPQIVPQDILQEPYATTSVNLFRGTTADPSDFLPNKVSELFTEKFIKELDTDPSMQYLNDILRENSIKTWKNKCKFVMTHGNADITVYYQNARDFYNRQKQEGGKVTFKTTIGDHVAAIVPYYPIVSTYLELYK